MDWTTLLLPVITQPHPELSPEQVIRIQLDALQNNDLLPDNGGIRLAFNFASPANREFTGPIDHFITIVNSVMYRDLIGFERAEVGFPILVGDVSQMRVRIIHKTRRAVYIFILSRQPEEPYRKCWMIDSVIRES